MFRGRIRRRRYTKTTADMGRRRHAKVVTFKESSESDSFFLSRYKAKSSTVPFPDDESSVSDDDSDSDEASEDDDDEDWEHSDDSFFFAYFAKTIDALKAVAATPYDFESEGSDSDWVPSLPKGRRRKLNTVRE